MVHCKGIATPLNTANISHFILEEEKDDGSGKADVMPNYLKKLILFSS